MDVSIVIVNYNTVDMLDECISSIKKETKCLNEIIVVDNASQDNSIVMLKEKYPDVLLIQNKKNNGFAHANNQGFKVAKGRYYFMLNPDTVVYNNAIDKLVTFMDIHTDTGVCSPKNIGVDGSVQFNCDHFPSIINDFFEYLNLPRRYPEIKLFNRSRMLYWNYDEIKNVDKVMGCSLLIRADLYHRLGGLDSQYFMYFEETDLCFQVKKSGYKIQFIPDSCILHYGGESSKIQTKYEVVNKTITKYFYESKFYFYRKNYGLVSAVISRILDILNALGIISRNSIRKKSSIRTNHMAKGKAYLSSLLPKFCNSTKMTKDKF